MSLYTLSDVQLMQLQVIKTNIVTLTSNNDFAGLDIQMQNLEKVLNSINPANQPDDQIVPDFTQAMQGFEANKVSKIIIGESSPGSSYALYPDGRRFDFKKSDQIYMEYLQSIGVDLLKVIFTKGKERFFFYENSNKQLIKKTIGPNG